jgi:hypothetical protein
LDENVEYDERESEFDIEDEDKEVEETKGSPFFKNIPWIRLYSVIFYVQVVMRRILKWMSLKWIQFKHLSAGLRFHYENSML